MATTVASDAQRILVVDDDRLLCRVLGELIRTRFPDCSVDTCTLATDAVRGIDEIDYDVILSDVRMPDMDGLTLLDRAHARRPQASIVLMTGLDQHDLALRALRGGAFDYIQKPVDADYLASTIARALHARITVRELARERARLERRAKDLEHVVEDQTRELREANQMKDEFLATLSHELRTPLTAVLGWARLLLRGKLDEATKRQATEAIERNAAHQARLVEDLLDLSRIITGKLRLALHSIDPADTIETTVAEVAATARAKRIEIDTTGVVRGLRVSADADRLQQVLGNLLSNALKFTPDGGHVRVSTQLEGASVSIRVEDDGVGIEADLLPHVFDRFRQGEAALGKSRSGLGLGLAITQHIVLLHGGAVRAESEGRNRGAALVVTLPRTRRELSTPLFEPAALGDTVLDGVRVLVIEDDVDTRELVQLTLERAGATVVAVGTGSSALSEIERARPHVLLCDIGIPDGSGYDLIRRIRATEGRSIPAAAVTAYVRPEDVKRALAEGFDAHIAKPVEPSHLPRAVLQLLETARA